MIMPVSLEIEQWMHCCTNLATLGACMIYIWVKCRTMLTSISIVNHFNQNVVLRTIHMGSQYGQSFPVVSLMYQQYRRWLSFTGTIFRRTFTSMSFKEMVWPLSVQN